MIITLKYLSNCFILLIPIFIWNAVFYNKLPKLYQGKNFDENIPQLLLYLEKFLRFFIFVFPVFFKLEFNNTKQKIGLFLYLLGILIYFFSWILQVYYRDSYWSKSILGFSAPAYTTIIWLIGIGLIGQSIFFNFFYKDFFYIILALLFVFVHTLHSLLTFLNK